MTKYSHDILECKFCKTKHRRNNKARHLKSKLCKSYQKTNDIIKNFVMNYKKSDDFNDKVLSPFKNEKGEIIYLSQQQIDLTKKINDVNI